MIEHNIPEYTNSVKYSIYLHFYAYIIILNMKNGISLDLELVTQTM